MPFALGKRSIAARLISMPESNCRLQRRKLARRHKTSSLSLAISCFPRTDQIALLTNGRSIGQSSNREIFLQKVVEACASNVAVLDESGKILYVSKPWRLAAEKYGKDGMSHPLDLYCLKRLGGPNASPSNHTSALAEDIQDIFD